MDMAQFESSANFTETEKNVMRFTAALTRTPAEVSDELFAALQRDFSERQLVELTAAITWENYRARFNRAFRVEAEGFSHGKFCPLPERTAAGAAQQPESRLI
jgi:alkylhydroperoxidase family enzyme